PWRLWWRRWVVEVVVLWWRVEESEVVGRIDPEMGIILGVGRKSPPENFSDGGDVVAVVAGDWEGRPKF
ncbi:hypothetical protein Tco_1364584, partial [Tanacetum coccineum]